MLSRKVKADGQSKNCGQVCGRQRFGVSSSNGFSFLSIFFRVFFRGAPKCETENPLGRHGGGPRDTHKVPAASGRLSVGGAAAAVREGAV